MPHQLRDELERVVPGRQGVALHHPERAEPEHAEPHVQRPLVLAPVGHEGLDRARDQRVAQLAASVAVQARHNLDVQLDGCVVASHLGQAGLCGQRRDRRRRSVFPERQDHRAVPRVECERARPAVCLVAQDTRCLASHGLAQLLNRPLEVLLSVMHLPRALDQVRIRERAQTETGELRLRQGHAVCGASTAASSTRTGPRL